MVLTIGFSLVFVCTKMSTTTNSSNGTTCSSESGSECEVESDIKKMELGKKKLQQYMYVAFVVAMHNQKYLMKKERREWLDGLVRHMTQGYSRTKWISTKKSFLIL